MITDTELRDIPHHFLPADAGGDIETTLNLLARELLQARRELAVMREKLIDADMARDDDQKLIRRLQDIYRETSAIANALSELYAPPEEEK